MQTIAFKVKPDTDLYKNYFSQKKEKAFFNKLARTFLEEHIPEFKMYGLTDRLTVGLSEENARKYQGQLMKGVRYFDGEPLHQFKRSSELDKLWCKQVCARVNGEALYANLWWFMDFCDNGCFKGSYAMWDDKEGNVYGLIEAKDEYSNLSVPDTVERIKISEYYANAERVYPEAMEDAK